MYISRLIHVQEKEKEGRKTVHNYRIKYEVDKFVLSESLPHFTMDSFFQSRINLHLCAELLRPLSSEVVYLSPQFLGKIFLLTFP